MTSPGEEEPLPYEEISLPEFAERAALTFSIDRQRPGALTLRGTCPRCAAVMEFDTVDHLIEGTLGPRHRPGRAEANQVELLYCFCDDEHPKRPAGRKGCGAYWTLIVADQR